MEKISFDTWKDGISFMIDDEFDNSFLSSIDGLTRFMNNHSEKFSQEDMLSNFLSEKDLFPPLTRLKALISLIGFSEERLKRVVSLIRYKINEENFKSEWTVDQISRKMQSDVALKDTLVDFFINGRKSAIGKYIPLYYMKNFKLKDDSFIGDLQDFSYVERILSDGEIQGKYANEVGSHVENTIRWRLDNYKMTVNNTLVYDVQKEFPLLNKNIDILIPSVEAPIILIESSYNITTGSGQSKRADQLVELYGVLMKHNANHRHNKIIMGNYCDGFGWLGRQNDLHRIYDASDFVFNQTTLHILDAVLKEYYPPLF